MPFLMPTTGRDGGAHPHAYWTIAQIHLDIEGATAYAVYKAYHDLAAWSEAAPGQAVPIVGVEVTIPVAGAAYELLLYRYRSEPGTKVFGLVEELAFAHPAFAGATWMDFPALPDAE